MQAAETSSELTTKASQGGFEHGGGSQLLSSKLSVAFLQKKKEKETLSAVNRTACDPCLLSNPFTLSPV